MIKITLTSLATLFCLASLHNRTWGLEFHCMAFQGSYPGLHFQTGEDSDTAMEIQEYGLSPKYTYAGASPLTFYTKAPGEDGQDIRTPVAQFPLSPGYVKFLFIFYPNPQVPGTYQIYPIPNDDRTMPPGSYRVQNQTKKQVALQLNGKAYQFGSGQYQVFTPPPVQSETFELEVGNPDDAGGTDPSATRETESFTAAAKIPVHFVYQDEAGQWNTFFKKKWLYRQDIRTYVFIYNIDGVLQLKNFVEFVGN
jgi:hypothetical protein